MGSALDLVNYAIIDKPISVAEVVDSIMKQKVDSLIQDEKQRVAKQLFQEKE